MILDDAAKIGHIATEHFGNFRRRHKMYESETGKTDGFVKSLFRTLFVLPAKAGIQSLQ
jgi:hypothetical protein